MNPIHSAILAALPHRGVPAIDGAYRNLKAGLEQHSDCDSEILDCLDFLEKKPEAPGRQSALQKAFDECRIEQSPEVLQAAQSLLETLERKVVEPGTATIELEHIKAANIQIRNLLAEGDKAAVMLKDLSAEKDLKLDGHKAKSDSRQEGSAANASSSATGVFYAGENLTLEQTTIVTDPQHAQNEARRRQEEERDREKLRQRYLNYVFHKTKLIDLSALDVRDALREGEKPVSLADIYTALLTQSSEQIDGQARKESREGNRRISALEQLNREKRLVLLGDPGSGKSTFANFVAMCLAGDQLKDEENEGVGLERLNTAPSSDDEDDDASGRGQWEHGALLPVPIVLRDLVTGGALQEADDETSIKPLWRYLAKTLQNAGLDGWLPHLKKHLEQKKSLLILDGLDEIPEADTRRKQIKRLVENFAASHPDCRILLTSRTYAYKEQGWSVQGFHEAVLAPFSSEQIEQFVDRWYTHTAALRRQDRDDARGKAAKLKEAISGNPRLMELAERPLLLTLMAGLHASRGRLPEDRYDLYEKAAELLLMDWEQGKVRRDAAGRCLTPQQSLPELLKVESRQLLVALAKLAFEAHKRQPDFEGTADIPEKDLFYELMRISKAIDSESLRDCLSVRAGLLVPHGVEVYTFPHRTFQEYLAACYLTEQGDFPGKIAGLARCEPNRWREVVLLAGAKAARGAAGSLWSLASALCFRVPGHPDAKTEDLWGALLAGQLLVESTDFKHPEEWQKDRQILVRNWLTVILTEQHAPLKPLPTLERALAGRLLAALDDPRPGVGLRKDALPDIEWCEVPEGTFLMGSDKNKDSEAYGDEQPQHKVYLSAYHLSRYPVTNRQYQAFVDEKGYSEAWRQCWDDEGWSWKEENHLSKPKKWGGFFDLPNHPVVMVSWYEASAFCRWLTIRLQEAGTIGADETIRLPSEAEWERAARGEDGRIYPWGDDSISSELANYDDTSLGATSAVGCFPRGTSPYGCEEMSGNVWEWCQNWDYDYKEDFEENPMGPASGSYRVNRGGSWASGAGYCRSAYRSYFGGPGSRNAGLGFRLLRT